MTITDRSAPALPFYSKWVAGLLNDPRDAELVGLVLQCSAVALFGVSLFFLPLPLAYLAPIYWAVLFFSVLDRYTLLLHYSSHRPLFRPHYGFLNRVIPLLLAPFFGQSPYTYFAHHMAMHHREENLHPDLSSTMRYKRDRLDHWSSYFLRFLFLGLFDLFWYFIKRGSSKQARRVLFGEGLYWASVLGLAAVAPYATLVVFVAPLLTMRFLMMAGNWAQHAFVAGDDPANPYKASITCINTRYNRRCLNDGYHVVHHIVPRCHWTEHPLEFQRNLAEYARNDAIVFDGLDFFQVWACLMFRRWSTLEQHFVRLEGAPARNPAEALAFLRSRLEPIPEEGPLEPAYGS